MNNFNLTELRGEARICDARLYTWNFHSKHLACFYLNRLIFHLKINGKSETEAKGNAWGCSRRPQSREINRSQMQNSLPGRSRVTMSESVVESARKKRARFVRLGRSQEKKKVTSGKTVIKQEIKISRIFHKEPVRNGDR